MRVITSPFLEFLWARRNAGAEHELMEWREVTHQVWTQQWSEASWVCVPLIFWHLLTRGCVTANWRDWCWRMRNWTDFVVLNGKWGHQRLIALKNRLECSWEPDLFSLLHFSAVRLICERESEREGCAHVPRNDWEELRAKQKKSTSSVSDMLSGIASVALQGIHTHSLTHAVADWTHSYFLFSVFPSSALSPAEEKMTAWASVMGCISPVKWWNHSQRGTHMGTQTLWHAHEEWIESGELAATQR